MTLRPTSIDAVGRQARRRSSKLCAPRLLGVWLLASVAALLGAGPASAAAAGNCPNEAIRIEQRATGLPECRAYELVSSPGQDVAYIHGSILQGPATADTVASPDGERLVYYSYNPNVEDAGDGMFFLSSRSTEGWSTSNATPPQSTGADEVSSCFPFVYFALDLRHGVLSDGYRSRSAEGISQPCQSAEPSLVPQEPGGGFTNLFMQDAPTGAYQLVNLTPAGIAPEDAELEDLTADSSHVLFAEAAELVPGAPGGFDLYEWSAGQVRLVTYLPEGQPTVGEIVDGLTPDVFEGHLREPGANASAAPITHGASANGERVFFTAEGPHGRGLYVREHAMQEPAVGGRCSAAEPDRACTLQLDASAGGTGEGGGVFLYASADGARAFFLDERQLTEDATAAPGKPDLYEFDLEAPAGQRLKDLTVDESEPADVLGYSGASEDGAFLYFVAEGALTGTQRTDQGATAKSGEPNLYLLHEGAATFVATLSGVTDGGAWAAGSAGMNQLQTATSPNGEYFAFNSSERLTGYRNLPEAPGDCVTARGESTRCSEIFIYSAGTAKLACASCDPGGARPRGPAAIPAEPRLFGPQPPLYATRRLLDSGRLFFGSPDALVPEDVNGLPDVYEYHDGAVQLISSGAPGETAVFDEASESGADVFFVASQSLGGTEVGGVPGVYDARVDGGFPPVQAGRGEATACSGVAECRPAPGGSLAPELDPKVFSGPGNVPAAGGATAAQRRAHRSKTAAKALRRALAACKKVRRKRLRQVCRGHARRRFSGGARGRRRRSRRSHAGKTGGRRGHAGRVWGRQ